MNIVQETIPPFGGPSNNTTFTYTMDPAGNITSVTIPASVAGQTVTLSPSTNPATVPGAQTFFGADSSHEPFSLQSLRAATGLSFSDFGEWLNRASNNFYAGGTPTPAPQLPPVGANVTATYNGSYLEAHDNGTFAGMPLASGTDSGGVSITANFGPHTISTQFTSGILAPSSSASSAPGTIGLDGGYSVFASNFSNFAPIQIRMKGGFFGPSEPTAAPPETGGTFTGILGTAAMSGSYGAHR